MMLSDLATVIRSKNAGPFELTFDVLFANQDDYQQVVASLAGLFWMLESRGARSGDGPHA